MTSEARLQLYKRLLLQWNERVNLIGPEAVEHIDAHIEEAVYAAKLLRPKGEALDFGSGGGLPAIPMAIVSPEAHFHFVEVDQKKWAFLKHIVRECSLNATVHGDRLQRVLPNLPSNIELVTSRAVGRPEEWLPSLPPILADGATVALFQGTAEAPQVKRFEAGAVHLLPRGSANFLVTLTFHVEQP